MTLIELLENVKQYHRIDGDPVGRMIDEWLGQRCEWVYKPAVEFGCDRYETGCGTFAYVKPAKAIYCPYCGRLLDTR